MIAADGFGCKYCMYNDTRFNRCNLMMDYEYSIGKGCEHWMDSGMQRFYSATYYEELVDKYISVGVFDNPDPEDALCCYLAELLNRPIVKLAALIDPIKTMVFKGTLMRFIYSVLDRIRFNFQMAQNEQNRIKEALSWSAKRKSDGWQALVNNVIEKYGEYGFPGQFYIKQYAQNKDFSDSKMWEKMCRDWNSSLINKIKMDKDNNTELAKNKFEAHLEQNQKNIEKYLNSNPLSHDQFRQCWNIMHGVWHSFDFERLLKKVKLQSNYPQIVEIVNKMGRISKDTGEEWMSLKQGFTQQFENATRSDVYGITIGHDVGSLLPSELALFMDNNTEDLFIQKYLADQLQVFRHKSEIMNSVRNLNKNPSARRGPMIICLDTSVSMDGKPRDISQSVLLKAIDIAVQEKRKCFVIAFSVSVKPIDIFQEKQNIINLLKCVPSGDTDATLMIDATFKLLESNPDYVNADVLWVTDFMMKLVSRDRLDKLQRLRSEGTRFYGLRIGLYKHDWEKYFDQITTIGYIDSKLY